VSCRGRLGDDLTLSNIIIEQENMICRVLGSANLFFPLAMEQKIERENSLEKSLASNSLDCEARYGIRNQSIESLAML